MPYPCAASPGSIAPYGLSNNDWSALGTYTVNPAACAVSFSAPPAPQTLTVAVMEAEEQSAGITASGTTCSNYCEGGGVSSGNACSSTITVGNAQAQPISACHIRETVETDFGTGNAIGPGATLGPYDFSPAGAVISYNVQNTLALLTCPATPELSPLDSSYFYSGSGNIAGDACSQQVPTKLDTGLDQRVDFESTTAVVGNYLSGYNCNCVSGMVCSIGAGSGAGPVKICYPTYSCTPGPEYTSIEGSPMQEAVIDIPMIVTNVGNMQVSNLAYSPMIQGGSGDVISSAFATNGYVFDRIPASAQKAIWTWTAQFADFSGAPQDVMTINLNNLLANYQFSTTSNFQQQLGQEESRCEEPVGSQGGGSSVCNEQPYYQYSDTCYFNYDLSAVATLSGINNQQVTFPVMSSAQSQTPASSFSSEIIPYLKFDAKIPASASQELSMSYDVFSPLNYYSPENSIEMFPVNTPGALYLNYNPGGLSPNYLIGLPENSADGNALFDAAVANAPASLPTLPKKLASLGMWNPYPSNPISVTGLPTGEVFVLNGTGGIGADYKIDIMKPIPAGDFNASNYQPDSLPSTSSLTQWNNNWSNYWANVIAMQSNSTYVMGSIDLTAKLSAQNFPDFTPLNISADENGDIFIVGSIPGGIGGLGSAPAIVEITNPLSPSMQIVTTPTSWSGNSGVPVLSEIAASPTGGLVFAATPSSGEIYVFSGSDLSSDYAINLTYGSSGGGINGYGGALMNITSYLYQGGPYGVPLNGKMVGGTGGSFQAPNVVSTNNNADASRDFDSNVYHHPIGLQDVNGYLYVLDDWMGGAGSSQSCFLWNRICTPATGGVDFDILSVRVLNATGSNLPLDPSYADDMWESQTCSSPTWGTLGAKPQVTVATAGACYDNDKPPATADPACAGDCSLVKTDCVLPATPGSTQTSGQGLGTQYSCDYASTGSGTYYTLATSQFSSSGSTYPPYGWILSADIAPQGTQGQEVTFCASPACTFNPKNMPKTYTGGYVPAGPKISVSSEGFDSPAFSVNFNGTMDLLLTSGRFNPLYSELLTANLNILNYTKILQGEPSYKCYTSDGGNHGCSSISTQLGSSVSGPVYTFPNPLEYLENQGGLQMLSFAAQISSSYPSGTSNQGCQSLVSGGQGCTSNALYNPGPPSLTIQQDPVGWGEADQIIGKAQDSGDEVEVLFGNAIMATGTGTATYTISSNSVICLNPSSVTTQTTEDCPTPRTYPVSIIDLTTGQSTANTLTVVDAPLLSVQSAEVTLDQSGSTPVCSSDLVEANALDNAGTVTLTLQGPGGSVPLPSSATGTGSAYFEISTAAICGSIAQQGAGTYTVAASDQNQVSQSIYVVSTAAAPAQTVTPTTSAQQLTSSVGGYAVVPYSYTYGISQQWYGFAENSALSFQVSQYVDPCSTAPPAAPTTTYGLVGCPSQVTLPGTVPLPYTTCTIYSYAIISGVSDTLSAQVEGGATYLQSVATGGFYVPNMSDVGLIMPPQLLYTLENNKLFGTIYVNDTACSKSGGSGVAASWDCSGNIQAILNATAQNSYSIDTYSQPGGGTVTPGYATLEVVPYAPAEYGVDLIMKDIPNAVPAVAQNAIGFYYGVVNSPQFISLFDLYKQVVYQNPLYLYLNSSQYTDKGLSMNALGYHRLIYVMEDNFGNKLMAPVDVDVAEPVTIALSVNAVVDQGNSNQTTLSVSGTAGSYSDLGAVFTPLPTDQPVYLYYDTDLNYVNYDALQGQQNALDAVLCAYNLGGNLDCKQSDPSYQGRQTNAGLITFNPSYNSLGGGCSPPPNSLLAGSVGGCNVYGHDARGAIPSSCPQAGSGKPEFCMPVYTNGTGICTSQLGLFAVAYPDYNGNFNTVITACGSRQDQVLAKYYGWPSPQPISVTQVPLALSENDVGSQGPAVAGNELDYYYAPAQATAQFEIGLFELNYGELGVAALAACLAAVAALMFFARRAQRRLEMKKAKRKRKG
jgi:hypothetical protein